VTDVTAAEPGASRIRQVVTYGAMPLVALAFTQLLESGERQSLAVAAKGIKEHFHVGNSSIGLIAAMMTVIGVAGSFPLGVLADRMRRTWLLAGAMALWTVTMALNGIASTFVFLLIARMGVGFVEANGPAAVSLLSDYWPVKDRAKKYGLYQSGALGGALIGLGMGGVLVDKYGWRAAFFMWIPFGIFSVFLLLRQPEPERGVQDAGFGTDLETDLAMAASSFPGEESLAEFPGRLPEPRRVGTLDYSVATPREVLREVMSIKSMWFGVISLTVAQLLLGGLSVFGVDYFQEVHGLSTKAAGGFAGLLGLGSIVGILGGGFLSDRYLKRGHLNARVYVAAFGAIGATVVLVPAFASTNLAFTAPMLCLGGALLTLPVAPSEALVSDVVVPELRGRAGTIRSVVRALSALGPLLIGQLADNVFGGGGNGLRLAIVALCPVYAVGGALMLLAARHYPHDVAFVVAESRRRLREQDVEHTESTEQ
jgi:MFS family permease